MELKLLNSTLLSNQLTTNFATNWSKDGCLFVITDAKVHLLKLSPCVTNVDNNFTFVKSAVQVGEYYASEHTGIDIDTILTHLPKQQFYHSILNYNLSPKLKNVSPLPLRAIDACWSPPIQFTKKSQLLTVLSNTGNVEIFESNRHNKWNIVFNMTQCWVEHLKSTWINTDYGSDYEEAFRLLEKRVLESIATSKHNQ